MESGDLFPAEDAGGLTRPEENKHTPLAVRMRPRTLDEVTGQDHLLSPGKLLRRTIESGKIFSLIFYGPPGSGKTSLAEIISRQTNALFVPVNAVTSNVAEIRAVIERARKLRPSRRTLLFIDEIHRFNKAQQDVLMPDVENGNLILVGATTHNPSFSINGPLLSRSLVFELRPLETDALTHLMRSALKDRERGLGDCKIEADPAAIGHIAKNAAGDARRALNALEVGVLTTPPGDDGVIRFDRKAAEESCQRKIVYYDHDEDYHYDTVSAFIKSMRGSDPDAAIYWLAKMIHAGEDPRFIVRRILILASEDIGNADPHALILAQSGMQAVEFVGMPEARIILAQLVTYMACAPKSNACYKAIHEALEDVKNEIVQEVPDHLRDRSYQGADKRTHGAHYRYPHSFPENYVNQQYVPIPKKYYHPTENGLEKNFSDRLKNLRKT